MRKLLVLAAAVLFSAACGFQQAAPTVPSKVDASVTTATSATLASHAGDQGFDQFGYNYTARLFVGPADGVDRMLDGKVWGDPTYANDHLKMGWSKGWDEARFHGAPWTQEAYEDNEWNGRVPGGSGEVWHYKIIWTGTQLQASPYWREGGYPIWGQFEVIFSHGTVANEHFWEAHAVPTGFGGPSN